MQLNKAHKIEKAVASARERRPALEHPHLYVGDADTPARLIVTDSYVAARIPVEVEPGDTDGYVSIDAIKAARRSNAPIACSGACETVGVSYPRPEPGVPPKVENLIDAGPQPGDAGTITVGINPKLLHDLAQAMGCGNGPVRLTIRTDGALKPLGVRPMSGDEDGILMPVHIRD